MSGRLFQFKASAASGTTATIHVPDVAEDSPATESDDFSAGSIDSKWTEIDNNTLLTVVHDGDSQLVLKLATSATSQLAGVVQEDNADNQFAITCRVRIAAYDINFGGAGIAVCEDIVGNPTTAGLLYAYLSASADQVDITVQSWTDWDTFSGGTTYFSTETGLTSVCFRIVVDKTGGNCYVMYSSTGESNSWMNCGTVPISGVLASVDTFGCFVKEHNSGQDSWGTFTNFEYTTLTGVTDADRQFAYGAGVAI